MFVQVLSNWSIKINTSLFRSSLDEINLLMLLVLELHIFMQKKNKGFTLIELLVVIAIIGILSSVVLASLNTARQKSRDAKRIADIKQLQLALELYFDDLKAYPNASLTGLAPTYIPAIPVDPLSTGSYVYKYTGISVNGSCTSYHLGALLENTGHTALSAKSNAGVNTSLCASGADFDGTVVGLYDVKP